MTVKLRPPAALAGSAVHGLGPTAEYHIGTDGLVEVPASDVPALLGAGFTYPAVTLPPTWTTGTDAPNDGNGADGDFYLQTTADPTKFAVFQRAAGAWGSALVDTGVGA